MKDVKTVRPSFLEKQQVKARHWSQRWWAQLLGVVLMTGGFLFVVYIFAKTFCMWIASGR